MTGAHWYRLAADGVLVVHAGFVAFVVVGQLLILVGLWRRWSWVRGLRFRLAHLLAIVIVVAQSWAGVICPLTSLEDALRMRSGERGYEQGFVADWLHRLLFFDFEPWVFTVIYTAFAALVLATWIVGPPRRPRRESVGARPPSTGRP